MDERIASLETQVKHVVDGQDELKDLFKEGQRENREILTKLSSALTTLAEHQKVFDHIDSEFAILRDRSHKMANDSMSVIGCQKKHSEVLDRITWRLDHMEDRQLKLELAMPDNLVERLHTLEESAPVTSIVNSMFFKIFAGLISVDVLINVVTKVIQ